MTNTFSQFNGYLKEYYRNFNIDVDKSYDTIKFRSNFLEQLWFKLEITWNSIYLNKSLYALNNNALITHKTFIEIYIKKDLPVEFLITPSKNFTNSVYYLIDKSQQDFIITIICSNINYHPFFYITYDWIHCLILCLSFFIIGFISLLKNHKDILRLLISLELLFLSIAVSFVLTSTHSFDVKGYLIAMFLLTSAACESVVGLGLVINLFRKLKTALWCFFERLRR